ncbi:ABC transporter permease [Microbacterium sp. No. 7]|uniref:ABC transporter permease n=1 Tax=Microbacterium sp. No. 7 TaxID=1714373 RepID=UPI0006D27491|nr:iron ABC transporter permease [Microbacterium sp. No. 7]
MTIVDIAPPVAAPRRKARVRLRPLDIVAIVLGLAFGVLLVFPIATVLIQVFVTGDTPGVEPFANALALPDIGQTFLNTAIVVVLSTVLAVAIAVGFAWLNERTSARLGFIASVLPLTPLLVPTLAGTVGWVFLLAPRAGILNVALRDYVLTPLGIAPAEGPINIFSFSGLVFLYMLNIIPFIYLPVSAALSRLDPALEEASRVSGRGPVATLFRVTIPAIRQAIFGGVLIGLVIGLGTFSIAVIVGTSARIDVLAVRVYTLLTQSYPPYLAEAVALSAFLLVVVVTLSVLQRWLGTKGGHAQIGGRGVGAAKVDLGVAGDIVARTIMIVFVALSSVIPLLGLVYVSLRGYWSPVITFEGLSLNAYKTVMFDNRITSLALVNSIVLSVAAALITLVVATLITLYAATRGGFLARALDALAKAPGGLSHLVIAVAFLAALAPPPFRMSGGLLILLLAYIVFYMPQAYVSASSSYAQLSRELSEASAMSGASEVRTLTRIILPLMLPGLAGGAVVLFVLNMSEVTGSALLSGTGAPVVGFVMIDLWQNGTFPTIAALGVIMTVVTTTVTLLLMFFGNRRGGR